MFGLMKSRSCSLTPEQKLNRRLHYCGACKTMGRLYGQRTRFLLNNDAVFLAEVLSAISDTGEPAAWDRTYQSYNCLSLPATPDVMPLPLQYAAAGALAIAEFKIADQVTDSGRFPWAIAERAFSKSFHDTAARLAEWDFPLSELQALSGEQSAREAARTSTDRRSPAQMLAYLEEPTGAATALFFSHGARLVGKPELAPAMGEIGFKLGSLIYLLDAYEDYEKDGRVRAFNALNVALQTTEAKLSARHRQSAKERLWTMAAEIQAGLAELPLSAERAEVFASRLRSNLADRLSPWERRLPVPGLPPCSGASRAVSVPACACATPISFSARVRGAMETARSILNARRGGQAHSLVRGLAAPF